MAQFNEILEGGLNQLLFKRLGMHTGAPAPGLAPEIMPVLALESDRPEWAPLKREGLWSAGFSVPGVAAEQSWLFLTNPLASGNIAVVERLFVVAASDVVFWNLVRSVTAPGATTITPDQQSRYNGELLGTPVESPLLLVGGENAAVTAAVGLMGRVPGAAAGVEAVRATEPLILWPGSSLAVYSSANNVEISGTLCWRVRRGSQNELLG